MPSITILDNADRELSMDSTDLRESGRKIMKKDTLLSPFFSLTGILKPKAFFLPSQPILI